MQSTKSAGFKRMQLFLYTAFGHPLKSLSGGALEIPLNLRTEVIRP